MAYHRALAKTNDQPGLIVMASIFTFTSIAGVLLRLWSRRLAGLKFKIDDWLAITSLFFVIALNGIFIAGTAQGAITGHSPVAHDFPVTTSLEHLVEKYKFAFQITEKITFGLIKLSAIFLWKRVFGPVRGFRIFCWVMVGVVSVWSFAFFFATLFQCGTEWYLNWAPILSFLTQCSNTLDMLTVFSATDIITDFIIIGMPVPMIWRLSMSKKRKTAVSAIFVVGIFTVGAGIARMYIYLTTSYDKEDNSDFIADFTNFILWSDIEVNIALLCACLPTMLPATTKLRESFSSNGSKRHLVSLRSWTTRTRRPQQLDDTLFADSVVEEEPKDSIASSDDLRLPFDNTPASVQTTVSSSAANQPIVRIQRQNPGGITIRREIAYSKGV